MPWPRITPVLSMKSTWNNRTITVFVQKGYWEASCKRKCGRAIKKWSACCQSV
ncbi:hypothetical protein V8C37DRAFT_385397 [Trichoderma ceciliae]